MEQAAYLRIFILFLKTDEKELPGKLLDLLMKIVVWNL